MAIRTAVLQVSLSFLSVASPYTDIPELPQVLSVVFRMGGIHFAGATQMVQSNAISKTEAQSACQALADAVGGQLPASAQHKISIGDESWAWQDYRTSTKHLLLALANSLQHAMPAQWTLADCKPGNPLGPASTRVQYDPSEIVLLNPQPPAASTLFFTWDEDTCQGQPDFYLDENFTRLVFAADEGTEAPSLIPVLVLCSLSLNCLNFVVIYKIPSCLQGFVGWLHLCSLQLWVLMWPDIFHKASRKASSAIRRLEEGSSFLRRLMALFRFSRGPYKSSRFGRTIADARDRLAQVFRENPEDEFLQTWLPGIAKDRAGWQNCSAAGNFDFSSKDVLLLLKQREGLQSLLLFRASCDFSRLDFLVRCRSASLAGRYGQRCTVVFFL